MAGSKRFGWHVCESCARDFEAYENKPDGNWNCEHCGFDNKQPAERIQKLARAGHENRKKRTSAALADHNKRLEFQASAFEMQY